MKRKRSPSPPEDNSWDRFGSYPTISTSNYNSSKKLKDSKNQKTQKIKKLQHSIYSGVT